NSQLSEKSVKKVISKVADAGIEKIRFTGGEPLLRKDLLSILRFAKKQDLHVLLNTNGSLIDEKNAADLCRLVDDFLVSMHAFDAAAEKRLSGKDFFNKKISAVKLLAKNHAFIRAATILTRENIRNLEKMHQLVESLAFDQWVLLRPMPNAQNKSPISNNDVKLAVEKLLRFNSERKKTGRFFIENALPFCSYKPEKVAMVSLGAVHEDGNDSLVVDSSGKIRPSYFFDTTLGNALQGNFIECWNSPFMQQLRSMHFLPAECRKCSYLMPCLGGSRFCALQAKGSLNALDPLAKPKQYGKDLFLG
ncbi:MAG: radical SAM protein, partial [Candidatus Diapherotrites archaeon]|nr:radical SAM protein [Candidatus Diapherotrites archaeon]